MIIRQARLEDEDEVCSLWEQLARFYGNDGSLSVLKKSFRYALENPAQVLVFVVLSEGNVVGTGSLHQGHYSTWADRMYGHIEDLIVADKYRGKKLGRKLILHMVEKARELGLCRLELNTLKSNQAAHRLYEKIGFKSDSVVYELSLF